MNYKTVHRYRVTGESKSHRSNGASSLGRDPFYRRDLPGVLANQIRN